MRQLEGGHEARRGDLERKFLQIKRRGFFQVGQSIVDGITLRRGPSFGILCNVSPIRVRRQNRGQCHALKLKCSDEEIKLRSDDSSPDLADSPI